MKKALLAVAVLFAAASVADAQVKTRWRLEWSNEKPKIYTYRNALDRYENFWYVIFKLQNHTSEAVPLIVDVMFYTEQGKDLQDDLLKVDTETIAAENETPRKAEALKFGRFHTSVIDPEVEYKIIEHHAGLGNRSPGIVLESIEEFKKGFKTTPPTHLAGNWKPGDRLYLNPREIRQMRFLRPGQKIMGIAIFKGVDPRANVYELHISGLLDIIKITSVTEDEWKLEYEPQTLKLHWERVGDEFETERDVISRDPRKEYVIKKIGPIASKVTLNKLVQTLMETYKKEKEWKELDLKPDQIDRRRIQDGIDPLDTRIMAMTFKLATGLDLGYDASKDVLENERAVLRIHEWWVTNATKIVFNEATNRFEVKERVLPGTEPVGK